MIKLLCIPYAGASAEVYRRWSPYIVDTIEIIPLEMCGRGKRFGIPFSDSFDSAVDDLFLQMKNILIDVEQYAVFGHSMGSWLAYELYIRLIQEDYKAPSHMFFSGNHAPHIHKNEKKLAYLNNEDFQKEILKIGGTPKLIFDHKDLAETYVPIIRNDYRILEEYQYIDKGILVHCPSTVISGNQDKLTFEELSYWRDLVNSDFDVVMVEGNHFYVSDAPQIVASEINKKLEN